MRGKRAQGRGSRGKLSLASNDVQQKTTHDEAKDREPTQKNSYTGRRTRRRQLKWAKARSTTSSPTCLRSVAKGRPSMDTLAPAMRPRANCIRFTSCPITQNTSGTQNGQGKKSSDCRQPAPYGRWVNWREKERRSKSRHCHWNRQVCCQEWSSFATWLFPRFFAHPSHSCRTVPCFATFSQHSLFILPACF